MNAKLSLIFLALFLLSGCNQEDASEMQDLENSFSGNYEYRRVVYSPLWYYHSPDGQIEEITNLSALQKLRNPARFELEGMLDGCSTELSDIFIQAIALDPIGDSGEMIFACGDEIRREAITYTKEGRLLKLESPGFIYTAIGEPLGYDFYNLCLFVIFRVYTRENGVVLEVDEVKNCDTLMYSYDEPGFEAYLPKEESLPYIFENTTFRTDTLTALQVFLKQEK